MADSKGPNSSENLPDGKVRCFVCKKTIAPADVDGHAETCSSSTVGSRFKGPVPTFKEFLTTVLDPLQMEKEVKILKERLRVSDSEKSILRSTIDQLESSKRAMRKEKLALEETMEELKEQMSGSSNQKLETENKISGLEEEVMKLKEQNERLLKENSTVKEMWKDSQTKSTLLQDELNRIKKLIESSRNS